MARPGTMVYFSILPALDRLTDEQCGKLFRALLHYGESAEAPDFGADLVLPVLWPLIREAVDRDNERYSEKCEKNDYANFCKSMRKTGRNPPSFGEWQAGRLHAEPDGTGWNHAEPNNNINSNINSNINNNINSNLSANATSIPSSAAAAPLTPATFAPPSLQEVKDFVAQEALPVSSERFFNYYKCNGWRIGQNPMVDWKAACRRWSDKPREPVPAPSEIDGCEQMRRMKALNAVLNGERDT